MPIRVLVISDYTDFHSTRPEASIFLGLAKEGLDIHIMTKAKAPIIPDFKKAGIQVVAFHPEKKYDSKEIQYIRDYIRDKDIQILHLFNNKAITSGIQAAKGLDVKVVLYRGYSDNIHWYDPTAYTKFLHPRVDKIMCNSVGVEQHIQAQLFFDKRKTITINKGHDVRWYEGYEPTDIRKELGIDTDSFLFVNVANNRRMKGIPYLLKAFNKLKDQPKAHLLLIGQNMDTAENLSIIRQGSAERVHLLGFRKDVLNIVAACNVFVLSSIKGESITKSVIEAMSLEVTPLITDIPGNVELVENGVSGLVVPSKNAALLADAMIKLYADKDFCQKLGQGAKIHIKEKLNTLSTIQEVKQLYNALLKF